MRDRVGQEIVLLHFRSFAIAQAPAQLFGATAQPPADWPQG